MKKVSILEEDRLVCPLVIDCGYIGENKFEKLEFVIPKEYKKYNKKLNFRLKDGTDVTRLFDEGTDNIFTITSDLAIYDVLSCCVVFFSIENDDEIIGKSSIFKIKFDKTIPDEDISDYEPKVVILDGLISSVKELEKTVTENEKRREEYIDDLKQRVDNGEFNGKDALINGVDTLNIVEGENISLEQTDSTLKISGTYKYDDTNIKKSIQENKTNIDTNTQDINNLKQKSDDNKNSIDEINENLKNYSLITETGNKIDLTVNSSTYVMTLDLKDKNDNVLSTGSVDLPIESMIINVTYDSEKKELKFTLQNGNVIEVPLNDLISGLVTDESLENTLKNYALIKDVPTKVSQLENDLDYVKNTDYATSTVAGVVKTNAGLDVDENGMVVANTCNYDEYESKTDNTFISKGTLENVITGKNLETANNKVTSVGTGSTDIEYPSAKCTYKIKEDVDNLKSDILETGEVSDSFIHVEDSIKNELLKLEVVGVCEQETTTGKNKLDMSSLIATTSKKGVTFTNNGDGTFNVIGTADADTFFDILSDTLNNVIESGKKYYLYSSQPYNENSFNLSVILNTDNGTKYYIANKATSSDFNTINNTKLTLYIPAGQTINAKNVKSMLVESDVADNDFEPYTGGQPSPNPEFPQEIKTITDSLIVTSCNKNLCNGVSQGLWIATLGYSYGTNSVDNGLCIPVDGISSYTISSKVTQARYRIGFTTQNPLVNTSGTCYRYSVVDGTNSTITKSSVGYKYLIVNATDLLSIQIERGDKATPFEQHIQSQITANIPEDEFIGKIDDTYKDALSIELQDDGKYHLMLNKMVGKRILNSDNMIIRIVLNTGDIMYRTMKYTDISINKVFIILCNRYIGIKNAANRKDGNIYWNSLNRTIDIIDNRANITTIDEFKTWLSTHNLEVYYVLEEPYKVDLGIVDMPLSYNEITNIFTDSDLMPQINAKYYKNFISTIRNLQINNNTLKNELASIESRLSALENASASSGSSSSSSEVSNEPIEESGTTSDIQEQ